MTKHSFTPDSFRPRQPSRRSFIATTAASLGLAALLSLAPSIAHAAPDYTPEQSEVSFGFIALTDCSPIVIAHEKGFFAKYGIKATIKKGASWAAIRDMLSSGDIQSTHMLIGMPFASTMGLGGATPKPMIIPWMLNRNGQAITLSNDFKGKVGADPKALKPFVDAAKAKGTPLTFAMTFPPGTHAMWMRYYLAAGGINPDSDVSLVTIPPPQMVANMKVGKMDGFCVGEPWNARSIADNIGYTSVTTQDMWKDHPEKVLAFTEEWATKNPKTVKAILKAIHEASVWLDDMGNRDEACTIVSKPNYINCPKNIILGRMLGQLDYGDGRKVTDEAPMHFSIRNANYPQPKFGLWWLTQFRRWGLVTGAPDYEGVVKRVMRPDIYEEAMAELGVTDRKIDNSPVTLFDGVTFDPKGDLEAYATGFPVNSLKN
ncbi:CmpA/NrtA family ABC transporter substrate-binding protein [Rariglobus hedericola]|uniref:ABC transporter substrate-binding protein n=1 Tax=Rariglobus hedericola TaxID=2597822 RepID=A0A556QQB3_9BACT|nr:CmpA/NrtA family ABC transporter substrate-binding protein [Rariglobus hedericola]TSJ78812.1 ABC transporter substrate-binding protein [Rariglobus hedericola]